MERSSTRCSRTPATCPANRCVPGWCIVWIATLRVCSSSPSAKRLWRALGMQMQRRRIRREYLGLVCGMPAHPSGTIEGPIARDPNNRLRFAIVGEGKPSVTHYELRDAFKKHAELIFRLETGRTHQIRVHLAAIGHPIFNDPVYGQRDRRTELPGQALHAWRLAFRHPHTGVSLDFESPPPTAYVATRELLASLSS